MQDPASIRTAAWLILGTTIVVVLAGSVVVRLFDYREYPNFGRALWFTVQTVTTVGYGDVTPTRIVGRVVATVIMVAGIGFITVVTACVTSMFVQAARERPQKVGDPPQPTPDLESVAARLEQIERTLAVLVEQTRPGQ
jgi:voltage-gated potassium channel